MPNPRRFARRMAGRLKARGFGSNSGARYFSTIRPNTSGVLVDEVTSLNLAGIWRGVTVKAGDLAKLPLGVYEKLEGGGKRPDPSSKIHELLHYPNADQTGRKLRLASAVHLILWGNSYQEILRDPETGEPESLRLIDPRWPEPRRDEDGRLLYWLKGNQSPWSRKKWLLPENVVHFSGLSLNGDSGLTPIGTNAEPLGIAKALDQFAGTYWGNGAVPNGIIECPPGWDDDARANFRQLWIDEHGGVSMANRVGLLEEGAKFVATGQNPEQSQMLGAREYSVVEVARIIGIPPHKLYDMSHDVERGLEESNRDYYETDLEPILQGMADEYALKLLTVVDRKRWLIGFDMNSLMKPTALARAQTSDIEMRNGVLTQNEWRADLGRNPFPEDVRLIPMNMQPVDAKQVPSPSTGEGEADDQPTDPEPLPSTEAGDSK